MALDYVRFQVPTKECYHLLSNSTFRFEGRTRSDTGEIPDYPQKAKIESGIVSIELKGKFKSVIGFSPHKYYNYLNGNGAQNYNSITLAQCYEAIEKLSELLGVNLWEHKVNQVEYGVNIRTVFSSKDFLHDSVLLHKWDTPERDKKYGKGYLLSFKNMSDYEIKFYSKDKQYGFNLTKSYIMRFEVKFKTPSRIVKGRSFLYGKMLRNIKVIDYMEKAVLQRFKEIVFVNQSLAESKLSGVALTSYLRYCSNAYLASQMPCKSNISNKEYQRQRKRAQRSKNHLNELNDLIGFSGLINELEAQVQFLLKNAREGLKLNFKAA